MIRLLGTVAASDMTLPDRKRALMEGVAHLIAADSWIWGLGCQLKPGQDQVYSSMIHGGFTETQIFRFNQAVSHPVMARAIEPFFIQLASGCRQLTMTRDEIDPAGLSLQSEANEHWLAAGVEEVMMSCHPLDDNSFSCTAFYRLPAHGKFGQREKSIVDSIMREVAWIHWLGWPEDRGARVPELSRQQRIVLNLLLDGHSSRDISTQMELSLHTVSDYIKDVYQHFGVHSQAQLMSKFYSMPASLGVDPDGGSILTQSMKSN